MKIFKNLIQKFYENNLDRKKIISQLRRYHEKKYINMELLSMLLGVFKVQETRVKDIMIPRSNMVIIKKNFINKRNFTTYYKIFSLKIPCNS